VRSTWPAPFLPGALPVAVRGEIFPPLCSRGRHRASSFSPSTFESAAFPLLDNLFFNNEVARRPDSPFNYSHVRLHETVSLPAGDPFFLLFLFHLPGPSFMGIRMCPPFPPPFRSVCRRYFTLFSLRKGSAHRFPSFFSRGRRQKYAFFSFFFYKNPNMSRFLFISCVFLSLFFPFFPPSR